jgi:hypothetical protein
VQAKSKKGCGCLRDNQGLLILRSSSTSSWLTGWTFLAVSGSLFCLIRRARQPRQASGARPLQSRTLCALTRRRARNRSLYGYSMSNRIGDPLARRLLAGTKRAFLPHGTTVWSTLGLGQLAPKEALRPARGCSESWISLCFALVSPSYSQGGFGRSRRAAHSVGTSVSL